MRTRLNRPMIAGTILVATGTAGAGTLTLTSNANVAAGRAAYMAGGPTATQFNWAAAFPTGTTWTAGVLAPQITSTPSVSLTLPNLTVNSVTAVLPSSLNLANWIDGAGFDGASAPTADLALNGVESFDLVFGSGHKSVGLAIATGRGNDLTQVDFTGATFQFTAKDSGGNVIDTETFSLAAGAGGDAAWLTLNSDTPFARLEIREIGAASQADQYFSNIFTSIDNVGVVPLPTTAGMSLAGLGLLAVRRRRRA